jgi:hypothetical protein
MAQVMVERPPANPIASLEHDEGLPRLLERLRSGEPRKPGANDDAVDTTTVSGPSAAGQPTKRNPGSASGSATNEPPPRKRFPLSHAEQSRG